MKITGLLSQYYDFMKTEAPKMWNAPDSVYEELAKKQDDLLDKMNNDEIQYLIDNSEEKERYSYELILKKRKKAKEELKVFNVKTERICEAKVVSITLINNCCRSNNNRYYSDTYGQTVA